MSTSWHDRAGLRGALYVLPMDRLPPTLRLRSILFSQKATQKVRFLTLQASFDHLSAFHVEVIALIPARVDSHSRVERGRCLGHQAWRGWVCGGQPRCVMDVVTPEQKKSFAKKKSKLTKTSHLQGPAPPRPRLSSHKRPLAAARRTVHLRYISAVVLLSCPRAVVLLRCSPPQPPPLHGVRCVPALVLLSRGRPPTSSRSRPPTSVRAGIRSWPPWARLF